MRKDHEIYGFPNLGCLLGRAFQTQLSALDASLKEAGLPVSPAEYLVLRSLSNRQGLQLCEIGAMLGKDKGAISRCVAALEKKGLIVTIPLSHKCRKVFFSEQGEKLLPEIMKVAEKRDRALKNLLSGEELSNLRIILNKIINNN